MTALVSILITDLVPLREVAAWRSYVNVAATTGRSVGGPVGGWLADTVGRRWSFLGQSPAVGMAMVLIAGVVPEGRGTVGRGKLGRVDFLGAGLMMGAVLCFLLPLQIGGDQVEWSHPLVSGLLGGACVFGALFVVVEGRFAREPIVPLVLLQNRDVILSAFIMIIQMVGQTAVCLLAGLQMVADPGSSCFRFYFQVTQGASNTVAGAHLFPAVLGNAVGGLLAGAAIKG